MCCFKWSCLENNSNGVEHKFYQDNECDTTFTQSTKCIIIVSEVTLQSKTQQSKQSVNNSVYSSIKSSMNDNNTFQSSMGMDEVKEVLYINDGNNVPLNTPRQSPVIDGVGGGSIAGITIGSVLFLVILAFFVGRGRAGAENDVESSNEMGSDDSDLYLDDDKNSDSIMLDNSKSSMVASPRELYGSGSDSGAGTGGGYQVESKVLMKGNGLQMADLETGNQQQLDSNSASMGWYASSSSYHSVSSGGKWNPSMKKDN